MKPYPSRHDAGVQLGRQLLAQGIQADLVLGLPRGGVVVAAEVALALQCPFDAFIVRKVGHPRHREYAVGALAEDGTVLLDENSLDVLGISRSELEPVLAEERKRLAEYCAKFRSARELVVKDRRILIVDDGLATGATAEVAARAVRQQGARAVLLAVPVASESAMARLTLVCDQVISPWIDPAFEAVGQYYLDFTQTTDDEVQKLLPG